MELNNLEFPDKQLYITETAFRDAQQSHMATRMPIEDMLPLCEILDKVGYWSIECWGGATFDACLRFLNENPWERLRRLKQALPNTKLQMLLRGQNLVGYRNYADDVVESFIDKSIINGIDVIRVFDALNDIRNLEQSIKCIKKNGAICEVALSYTTSPVHDIDYFVNKAIEVEQLGADVICIKDMANLLLPNETFNLIEAIKERTSLSIHLHTHNTTGTGGMDYLSAAMAGVDIIDCALSPMANGTSQPATEPMVAVFRGTNRDTNIDLELLSKAAACFRPIVEKYEKDSLIHSKVLRVQPEALINQIPGGMLSNLISQLQSANSLDRIDDVLKEIPVVRADFGYPPLVTPTSQIVGTQAVLNVLSNNRYSSFTKESKDLLRGAYGKLPGVPNQKILKKALGNTEQVLCRPADLLHDELPGIKEKYDKYINNEEDMLNFALFPQIAETYYKNIIEDDYHEINVKWMR